MDVKVSRHKTNSNLCEITTSPNIRVEETLKQGVAGKSDDKSLLDIFSYFSCYEHLKIAK
jgi:hypothetical protein